LGGQLDFQLAVEQLALEQRVLAYIGGNHLADLAVFQQHAKAEAVDAAVVGDHGQAAHALALDLGDEVFRDATQAEAAGQHRHVVGQAFQGLFEGCDTFVESRHAKSAFLSL
jgi:hypothetical protein